MNSKKTKEEWRMIVRQRIQSGLSVKKWCDRNSIAYDTYKYWEKKLRTVDRVSDRPYFFQITYREIRIGISDTADISVLADIIKTLQALC